MPDAAPQPLSNEVLAEESGKHYRLLRIGVIALLALACAYPFSLNLVDPDLWGHVRYGQDWLKIPGRIDEVDVRVIIDGSAAQRVLDGISRSRRARRDLA